MNARSCTNCNNPVQPGAHFCARCGTAVAPPLAAPDPRDPGPVAQAPVATQAYVTVPLVDDAAAPVETPEKARWPLFVIGGLVVLGGAGLAYFFFAGDGRGGASSPSEAVADFVDAVNEDDPVLLVNAVAPSETEGAVDLLETIRTRLEEQGVGSWQVEGSDGAGFDVTIELTTIDVVEEAEGAALVEIDGSITVDVSSLTGNVGDALDDDVYDVDLGDLADDLEEAGGEELTITVVKEDGGWYVSPIMTVFTLAAQTEGYDVDLDAVTAPVDRPAETAQEAVEIAIEAGAELDFDTLAGVMTPAGSRVLLAYEDVFDDAVASAEEQGYELDRIDVTTTDLGGGLVGIDEVEVEASTFDDSTQFTVDGDCVEADGDRVCLLDGFDGQLDHEQIVMRARRVGDGYAVDPIGSMTTMVGDLVRNVDYEWWLDAFDIREYATPVPVSMGQETEIDFGGKPFAVVEFTPAEDSIVQTSVYGDHDWSDTYVADDGVWHYDSLSGETSGDPVRAVIRAPYVDDCDGLFCSGSDGTVTFVAHSAQRQELSGPDQIVSAELARGDGFVFEFAVSKPKAVSFVAEEGDVLIEVFDGSGYYYGDTQLVPGDYQLRVWNTSDAPTRFRVVPTLLESASGGQSDGTVSQDVQLGTSGFFDIYYFEPFTFVDVFTQSYGDGDVILEVYSDNDASCEYVDSAYAGGAESCSVQVGTDGAISVSVIPYDAATQGTSAYLEIVPS